MAHGIRFFGQVYNDHLRPDDPFAFLDLLAGDAGILAVQRNRKLVELAEMLRQEPTVTAILQEGSRPDPSAQFVVALADCIDRYGDLSLVMGGVMAGNRTTNDLLLEMAAAPSSAHRRTQVDEAMYLASFTPEEQEFAQDVLAIGRASYRLRDNDNLAIGRLSQRLHEARNEAIRRQADSKSPELASQLATGRERVSKRLSPVPSVPGFHGSDDTRLQACQLVGQPAGPGLGVGPARVISQPGDLASFKAGEILVCDAVYPNMNFVVPLAGGIVERCGGMLIHVPSSPANTAFLALPGCRMPPG